MSSCPAHRSWCWRASPAPSTCLHAALLLSTIYLPNKPQSHIIFSFALFWGWGRQGGGKAGGGLLPVAESGGLVGSGSAQSGGCLGPSSVSLGTLSPVVDLRVPVLSVLGGEREPCQVRLPRSVSRGVMGTLENANPVSTGTSDALWRGAVQVRAELRARQSRGRGSRTRGWGWACLAGGGCGRCHNAPRGVSGVGGGGGGAGAQGEQEHRWWR